MEKKVLTLLSVNYLRSRVFYSKLWLKACLKGKTVQFSVAMCVSASHSTSRGKENTTELGPWLQEGKRIEK